MLHVESAAGVDGDDGAVQVIVPTDTLLLRHQPRLLLLQRQRLPLWQERAHAHVQDHER